MIGHYTKTELQPFKCFDVPSLIWVLIQPSLHPVKRARAYVLACGSFDLRSVSISILIFFFIFIFFIQRLLFQLPRYGSSYVGMPPEKYASIWVFLCGDASRTFEIERIGIWIGETWDGRDLAENRGCVRMRERINSFMRMRINSRIRELIVLVRPFPITRK